MESSDWIVSILIIIVIAGWSLYHLHRWLYMPHRTRLPFEHEDLEPPSPSPETRMLEEAGYEIISGKRKVLLRIEVDEDRTFTSNLWIDYFVRKDDEIYAVKTMRRRKPVDWTGSGLRDYFLPYALVYDKIDGVLYIHPEHQKIHKIVFHIE
jgi:hypothetical protein